MKLKYMIRVAIAAAAMITSTSVFAQWTVYDPVNWIQNMSSARAAISNEINTTRALVEQVKAAKDLAKSTNVLKNVASLAGLDQARQLYRALIDVDGRLGTNLDSNTKLLDDLRAQYGASNMTWDQFTASRSQIESRERQLNKDRYTAVAQSMEETSRRRQEIVSQLSSVQGQTEAMQTLGAALDVIIGQNQQIIAAMMANNRMQESKGRLDGADEQMAKNQRELYQQRLREAASKY
jgi:hypothetical protein